MSNIKELSKMRWDLTGNPSTEQLQLSCLMRIADATEKMAQPFVSLLNEVRLYKEENARLRSNLTRLRREIAGHKGAFTKLKNNKEKQCPKNESPKS